MSQTTATESTTNDTRTTAAAPKYAAVALSPAVVGASRHGFWGLPRTFWLLWVGTLVNRLGGGVFPFLALYLTRERGISAELAGTIVGLYAAGGMVAGPVGGTLCDRLGRRPTILLGTSLAAATMLVLGGARTTLAIVLIAPLLGFFTDMCRPALQAAVADVVQPRDRRRAYGLLYWAINLGFSGAAILAGGLAQGNFALLFALDAVTTLAFGLIVLLGVPESRPAQGETTAPPEGRWATFAPFRDRAYLTFALIQLPVLLIFQQAAVALPLDMRAHGLEASEIGRLLAVNGIAIVLLQPLGVRLSERYSFGRALSVGAALTGVGFGLTAVAAGAPGYAMAIAIWTLGEIAFSTATPALVAELSPVRYRGRYQGAHQLTWGMAGIVAPALGGAVLSGWGAGPLWLACAIVGATSALLHERMTAQVIQRHRAAISDQPRPSG